MTRPPSDMRAREQAQEPFVPTHQMISDLLRALDALACGDVVEFKVVRTRRGIDVLVTNKMRYGESRG